MRLNGLRRFSSAVRSGLSLKNSKSELNFKEGNELANPYDVIDRNVSGMEQRLRLYEMRRLQEQLKLDRSELENMKRKFASNSKFNNNNNEFQYGTKYFVVSNFPGTNCPSEISVESSVAITVDIKSLGLLKSATNKITNSLNIGSDAQSFEFTVSDFPLISQNKARAVEILKAIVNLAKSNNFDDLNDILLTVQNSNGSTKSNRLNSEAKVLPGFPQEWLQFIK